MAKRLVMYNGELMEIASKQVISTNGNVEKVVLSMVPVKEPEKEVSKQKAYEHFIDELLKAFLED